MLDGLEPQADGLRHVVLDLRGLTFMDVLGLAELIRQNEFARSNHHNLAVVRGTAAIQRVLERTGVEDVLVLVDDPDDLVPPPITHRAAGSRTDRRPVRLEAPGAALRRPRTTRAQAAPNTLAATRSFAVVPA